METLSVILSIVASIVSIVATIVAFKSKKEIRQLRDVYENNQLFIKGNANTQIVGNGNKVTTHGK